MTHSNCRHTHTYMRATAIHYHQTGMYVFVRSVVLCASVSLFAWACVRACVRECTYFMLAYLLTFVRKHFTETTHIHIKGKQSTFARRVLWIVNKNFSDAVRCLRYMFCVYATCSTYVPCTYLYILSDQKKADNYNAKTR